tara:strand:+ start:812 stop:1048 length:237 start_codon:yes stop_codon:yes gene_type:complete
MKNFVITIDKNRLVTDSSDAAVFIFENIKGYEDEVFDLLDIHNIKMSELETMVNSWGGKIRSVTMRQLISSYYKNNLT